ncbi:Rrf2 family transcriptional regulator [Kordia sp. YSTF-M3]|uniref:Rrf2 family transcriptional regulator n=1 Tax=Kordia aestuariivivens TaxID=2759037 RepID=A0ABR7Q456_9FLAO|nr:Rrf2 family transcriptional regulator [Kordia aestuariivivens]MBC8753341.1 Rrf2 family transcriptional regulator [Kordia aestuariivivens]
MFSKACEYGIRALIFIAMKSSKDERVGNTAIAIAIDSPSAFTAKILQKLVKAKIIKSVKGPYGGFEISEEGLHQTKLTAIVKAIDGDAVYNRCGLGLSECSALKPCPLHDKFKAVRADLKTILDATTLKELASQLEDGTAFLKL